MAVALVVLLGGSGVKLALSDSIALTSQTIPSTGGSVVIQQPGGPLDGMTLNVPAGSYAEDMEFEVSYQEIHSHRLDDISTPASPVISIDNGHTFADQNMTLTIPIQKTDDEFAMAFYYDPETEELQGLPFTELTNDHITVATGHFSLIVVLKAAIVDLEEYVEKSEADSGFRPGFDDFQMTNYGSYAKPDGHCAGQSITAMVYYNNRDELGWDQPLYNRFDNDGCGATTGFMWDDALALRLCSYVQNACDFSWRVRDLSQFDLYNYLAFVYAIKQTKNPQYISIGSSTGGHAMIVYRVTESGLYVADPNRPGETRKIEYADGDLKPYASGATAQQALNSPTAYTTFDYCGDGSGSAFVKESVVIDGLQKVMENKDATSPGLFPADPVIQLILGDSPGMKLPLRDGLVLSANNLSAWVPANTLEIEVLGEVTDGGFVAFNGTKRVETTVDDLTELVQCPVDQGVNDLGFLYATQDGDLVHIIDFYRFSITLLGPTALLPSPESDISYVGFAIPFSVTMTDGPDEPVYTWDYGDGAPVSTDQPTAPHAYGAAGLYEGTVSVTAKSTPELVLASATFSVIVEEEGPEGSSTTAATGPGATAGPPLPTSPGGSSGIPSTSGYQTLFETAGAVSETFLDYYPSATPLEVGATSAIEVPAGGTVKITVDFASSMGGGPRFYGDEMGYRVHAGFIARDQNGDRLGGVYVVNGYDTEFARASTEVSVSAAQTITVQVIPQNMSAYENKIPASDGDYYLYIPGQYRMRVEFKGL